MQNASRGVRRAVWRRTAPAVFVVAALVLASCSSDDDASSSEASGGERETTEPADVSVLGEEDPATGSPVKVGFVTGEGGTSIDLPQTRESAEAAVEYANTYTGGLAGHEIELVTCEDKSDGASATACANRFVEEDVVAVVAGQVSDESLYMPALESAGIPWIISSATGGAALASDIAFGVAGGFIGGMGAMAELAAEEGSDVVFFGIDAPAFTAAYDAIGAPTFEAAGVNAEIVTIPAGTPDATSQVTAGLESDPGMIVVVAEQTLCKAILPAIGNLAPDTTLIMGDPCADPSVIDAVGVEVLEGAFIYNASASLGDDEEGQLYRAVLAEYSPDTDPQGKTGVGYIATMAMVRAVNQVAPTGGLTAEVVLDAMKTATDVPIPGWPEGTFTCDRTAYAGAPALCSTSALFATFEDGNLVDHRVVDGGEFLEG